MNHIVLLLFLLFPNTQQDSHEMELEVQHNEDKRPSPDWVVLSFDKISQKLPVRDGKIEVPLEAIKASKTSLMTEIGNNQVEISMPGEWYGSDKWQIIFSDNFEKNSWPIPKDADPSSACVLLMISKHRETIGTFIQNCRKKLPSK
jgi:hypothetical protein